MPELRFEHTVGRRSNECILRGMPNYGYLEYLFRQELLDVDKDKFENYFHHQLEYIDYARRLNINGTYMKPFRKHTPLGFMATKKEKFDEIIDKWEEHLDRCCMELRLFIVDSIMDVEKNRIPCDRLIFPECLCKLYEDLHPFCMGRHSETWNEDTLLILSSNEIGRYFEYILCAAMEPTLAVKRIDKE